MIWFVLLGLFAGYLVLSYVAVKRRQKSLAASAVTEATIDSEGILKRRADGIEEIIAWGDVVAIQIVHRTTEISKATEILNGFTVGRHLPVDEPTMLVFHGENNGAVLPAWPDLVEDLLVHMRHRCKMGTKELLEVRERIELVERGVYEVWNSDR
ncbi:MAG: hypothetical protein P8N50_00035 [Actinomycetota bacterium]|nr:hypothetical protein [Actinomycetota bacterium]